MISEQKNLSSENVFINELASRFALTVETPRDWNREFQEILSKPD